MLATVHDTNDEVLALSFMADHGLKMMPSADARYILRMSEGRVLGCVVYNGFNGRVCSMHCAGDGNWISREFLKAAFTYPFVICNMVQIFGSVAANNLRALKLNKHLGFEVMHRIRHGWDDRTDLIIMGMNKAQCRWLQERKSHGIQYQTAAAA